LRLLCGSFLVCVRPQVALTGKYLHFLNACGGLLTSTPALDMEAIRPKIVEIYEGMLQDQVFTRRMEHPADVDSRQIRVIFAAFLHAVATKSSLKWRFYGRYMALKRSNSAN
jgi:hypothetical protein